MSMWNLPFHGNQAQHRVFLMQVQQGKLPSKHGWWAGGREGCLPLTLLAFLLGS